MVNKITIFTKLAYYSSHGILENKKCTTVGFCEPDVRNAGGHYIATGMDGVVVDGKLVTGATWLGNAPG